MAKSCVWTPKVKTKSGSTRESNLYKDLLSYTNNNRDKALDIYFLVRGTDFKNTFSDIIKYDDADEPILSSFIGKAIVKDVFDDKTNIERIAKSVGTVDKYGDTVYIEDNAKNYNDLAAKAIQFNDEAKYGQDYVAVVKSDENGLYIGIERRSEENTKLVNNIKYNYLLNEKIKSILLAHGVDISNLYTLQNSLRENGIVDYEHATVTAEGLLQLIRLADSREGSEALPEEFAHFMLDIMRGKDIFVDRLFNMLAKKDLYKEILGEEYESYVTKYSQDETLTEEEIKDRLIREAAGKMVADAMTNPNSKPVQKYEFFKNLIEHIKAFIKGLFNGKEINQAVADARNAAYSVATTILNGDDNVAKIKLESIEGLTNLSQLAKRASNASDIIQKTIDRALKKYDYYNKALHKKLKAATTEEERDKITEQINKLSQQTSDFLANQKLYLQQKSFDKAVSDYISYASKELNDCLDRLKDIINHTYSDNEVPYQVRNIRNIIQSHLEVINDLSAAVDYPDSEITMDESVRKLFNELRGVAMEVDNKSKVEALECFSKFLEAYLPEGGISYNQGRKTVTISRGDISELLKTAEKDITFIDMWINSAAETKDIIIKLSDAAIKAQKDSARQEVIGIQKKLLAVAKPLKDAGIKEDFIFEKHKDGTLSNRYRSEINWTAWYDSKAAKNEEIQKGLAEGKTREWATNEWRQWRKENCTSEGFPDYKYRNPDFKAGWTQEQINYYDTFMDIRRQMISYLPVDTYSEMDPYKAIQVTKDLWERIKSTPLGQIPAMMMKETVRNFTGNVDDTEFGYATLNFAGERQYGVPIYFIKDVENESDLSRDATSTLLAFADMATNYDRMEAITDIFEIGKEVVSERKAKQTRGSKKLVERLKGFGETSEVDAESTATNIIKRFNHLMESQIYGKYLSDATVGETNVKQTRVTGFLIQWTSLCTLALNKLAGEAAVINDMINIDNEALAARQFTGKQLMAADKEYNRYLPNIIGSAHNPIKTDKLNLFIEKFDVLHEYEKDIRDLRWDTSRAKKFMSTDTLYLFMTMGSHFGETRTAIAQAMNIQITSDDGTKTKSLWDILQPKPIDPQHPERGATLEVEEGFTLTQADVTKYSRKFMALNERLFGAYNKADRNMLQSTAIGQLGMLYRKFMIPAINRRFRGGDYNLELGEQTEGFYVTMGRFLYDLATDSQHYGRSIAAYWGELSDYQKQNFWRATRELGMFTLILGGLTALLRGLDWNKKDAPWWKRNINYLTARAKTELGAFTPLGIFGELSNLVKSPFPTLNVIERFGGLINLFNPWSWNKEVKSGRYKGHSKAYKAMMENIPMMRTIWGAIHPEEKLIAFQ